MSRRRMHDRSLFARLTRSEAMRWLMVVVLAPLLSFGALGGGEFLAHSHDEHSLHLHDVEIGTRAAITAADYASDHGHDHADPPATVCETSVVDGYGEQDRVPPGILISLTDDAPRPTRGITLSGSASPSPASLVFGSPRMPPSSVSSVVFAVRGRLDLQSARACDRLMRTSCALLI